jgi:hypothetical protein
MFVVLMGWGLGKQSYFYPLLKEKSTTENLEPL